MELLETQDPEKKKLIETSERHKRALEKEVQGLSQQTDRILKNALVIGGTLALTYLVISSVSTKRKKKKKKLAQAAAMASGQTLATVEEQDDDTPSLLVQVGKKIIDQASLVLLDIAREKVSEYLANRKKQDENS